MAADEVIARRYALALAEHAREEGQLKEVQADLKHIARILETTEEAGYEPKFAEFLSSPSVSLEDKLALTAKVVEELGVGKIVNDFIGVLIRHGRAGLMLKVVRQFAGLAGELTGELSAVVHTARPLSPEQAGRLSEALAKAFSMPVRMHQRVEPGLLAGARITIGDKTFDGTVLGRLDRLRHRLTAETLSDAVQEDGEDEGAEAGEEAEAPAKKN